MQEHLHSNKDVHSVYTGYENYLHKPPANFSCFQKANIMLALTFSII
jgi:hypothetical protein